jgi:nudix-type nucleoside diphosphatase (YffH/AdpP family)
MGAASKWQIGSESRRRVLGREERAVGKPKGKANGEQAAKRRVDIITEEEVFSKAIFHVREAHLRFERYDGSMTDEVVRLNLDRGDSVAALLYDDEAEAVVLVEQFRYPTYANGPGWILELPAGMVAKGEDAAQQVTIRRELLEEIGYEVETLDHILTFYVSPGGSSERILLYFGRVQPHQRTQAGGGLASEGEDIRMLVMPLAKALAKVESGAIQDAKTILALQWLQLHPQGQPNKP